MANGNGSNWKDWLIGVLVPINFALVGYIWMGNQNNSIRIEGDFRGMIKDVATIKQQVEELNRRMERIENRGAGGSNQTNLSMEPSHQIDYEALWGNLASLK